jgi:hypothetical protein
LIRACPVSATLEAASVERAVAALRLLGEPGEVGKTPVVLPPRERRKDYS